MRAHSICRILYGVALKCVPNGTRTADTEQAAVAPAQPFVRSRSRILFDASLSKGLSPEFRPIALVSSRGVTTLDNLFCLVSPVVPNHQSSESDARIVLGAHRAI